MTIMNYSDGNVHTKKQLDRSQKFNAEFRVSMHFQSRTHCGYDENSPWNSLPVLHSPNLESSKSRFISICFSNGIVCSGFVHRSIVNKWIDMEEMFSFYSFRFHSNEWQSSSCNRRSGWIHFRNDRCFCFCTKNWALFFLSISLNGFIFLVSLHNEIFSTRRRIQWVRLQSVVHRRSVKSSSIIFLYLEKRTISALLLSMKAWNERINK